MELDKQIRFDLDNELYIELNEYCSGGDRAEFIRQAIREKLNRKKISEDETYRRIKQIDKLDTESIHNKVVDIEFTNQVVYEEIKKQNEILKLVLRRTTLGALYSKNILDTVTRSEQLSDELQEEGINVINDEINQLNF